MGKCHEGYKDAIFYQDGEDGEKIVALSREAIRRSEEYIVLMKRSTIRTLSRVTRRSFFEKERLEPRRHGLGICNFRRAPCSSFLREEELVIINAQSLLGEGRARRRRRVHSIGRRLHFQVVPRVEPRPEVDLDLYMFTVVLEGRVKVRRLDARAVPGLELPRRAVDRTGRAPGAVSVGRLEAEDGACCAVGEVDHVFLQRRRGLQGGVQLVHRGTHRCADV